MSTPSHDTERRLLSDQLLSELVKQGLLQQNQVRPLVEFLDSRRTVESETRFNLVHLCWYLGAAVALTAYALFAAQIADSFGSSGFGVVLGITAVAALGYAIAVTAKLRFRSVLAGLLVMIAVLTAGAAILAFQDAADLLHHDPFFKSKDYATLSFHDRLLGGPLLSVLFVTVASAISLAALRFIPLTVLVTVGCWYLIYDQVFPNGGIQEGLTITGLGIATVITGWLADVHAKENYGYWLNKLGMGILPIGLLQLFDDGSEGGLVLYAWACTSLIFLALYLRRPAGVLGGAGGVLYYLHHIYDKFFRHSLAFPFVMVLVGGWVMFVGWKLYRYRRPLDEVLPATLRRWRPRERTDPVVFGG